MIIYLITNKLNGKIYVGQTVQSLEERWYGHCHQKCTFPIDRAIRKHSPENFTREVIAHANTQEELDYLETYFIIIYDAQNPEVGYNLADGGQRGARGYKWTIEQRQKQSERLKANPLRYWAGKKRSPETCKKISEGQKGKKATKTQLKGLEKGWNAKKPKSEEHKQKLREARMKQVNPWIQHRLNEEVKLGKVFHG
jgi:group I intron endonuclease